MPRSLKKGPFVDDHLLKKVDTWFAGVLERHPAKMQCKRGCFDCCLGIFDISIADAALLKEGLGKLDPAVRAGIEERSRVQLARLPQVGGAATLEEFDDDEIDAMSDAIGTERCVCLGEGGECLVYEQRPMVCRLNGAPIVDVSGRVVHGEGCFKNSVTTREVPRIDTELIRKEERRHLMRLKKAGFAGIESPEATMFIPMAVLRTVEREA